MAKTSNYRRWLRDQIANLDDIAGDDERGHQRHDDVQFAVLEAGRLAAIAGAPAAVKLCNVRRGGLTVATAQEILAGCLAELPAPKNAKQWLTPPEAAKRYGVSPDTVRKWIADGELVAVNVASPNSKRPRHRIEPDALADFDKRRKAAATPPSPRKRRRKGEPELLITRFSC